METFRKKGDNTLQGYIEIVGNNIENYEKGLEADKLEKSKMLTKSDFRFKVSESKLDRIQRSSILSRTTSRH